MSADGNLTVNGALKINNLPDLACFQSFEDLLKALPTFLTVEVPSTITNVIISNVQPQDNQRDAIWFRRSNSGEFIGIYLYSSGTWRLVFPSPNALIRMYGDSRDVPEGYILADETNPNLTANQASFIKSSWLKDPTDTWYVIFDVTWVGF